MPEMTDLLDPRRFNRQPLLLFIRAFNLEHVNDNTGLFAVYGKRFIIFNGPIGLNIDDHVVF